MLINKYFRRGSALLLTAAVLISIFSLIYIPASAVEPTGVNLDGAQAIYLYNIEKSTDGVNWESVNDFPFEYFYRPRDNELGTFKYGTSFVNTAIPHFPSEDDATDYIRGDKDPWDADNWDDISDHFPDGGGNHPGTPDPVTIMGEVTIGTVFSQQYVLTIATLTEIATEFFDTSNGGAWEDIKKGLGMYGDSPIESVMDLTFYPVNMDSVYGTSPQSYIYFGGYQMNLS